MGRDIVSELRRADENAWVVPDEWWALADRIRGRGPVRPRVPKVEAEAAYPELEGSAEVSAALKASAAAGFAEVAEAGLAVLAGRATTPLGVAAVAAAVEAVIPWDKEVRRESLLAFPVVDAWVVRYGVVFAAEAAVALAGLDFHQQIPRDRSPSRVWPHGVEAMYGTEVAALLAEVRDYLVESSDVEYSAALEVLGRYRAERGSFAVRLATSYLLPTEQHWFAEDVSIVGGQSGPRRPSGYQDALRGLIASATTLEQLAALPDFTYAYVLSDRVRCSVVTNVGPAVASATVVALDRCGDEPGRQRVLAGVLAHFPTDEAFAILLERIELPTVRPALLEAAQRFPRRALRLLAASTSRSPAVANLLRTHGNAHPELAAELGVVIESAPTTAFHKGIAGSGQLPEFLAVSPFKRIPALPHWLVPAALPPIVLRDNSLALPSEAVITVCAMLTKSGPKGDHAGVAQLRAVADPVSLADFAWALFETWRLAVYPASDGWVLHVQGLFGDDDTARRLTPFIRAWPGESQHRRAVTGLEVLAAIGTDVALRQLNGIAERVKFKGIKAKAREMIGQLARDRGLSPEQLADRLVPNLGLHSNGPLRLDYGPRGFVIGFDAELNPTISDADGSPRRSLPKPGPKDDPAVAPLAYKAFAGLKKDVKAVAREQILRMEAAMVRGRRWTAAEHRQLLIDHPLLRHLTRRLVWAAFDADGTVTGSFRIAEDHSLADVRDDTLILPADAVVGLAHPVTLGAELPTWQEVFADYELLQPFSQLHRETYLLTAAETAADTLDRFHGHKVPIATVAAMTYRGWKRETPQSNGDCRYIYRPLPEGYSVLVHIDPGLNIGLSHEDQSDQQLTRVHLVRSGDEQSAHADTTLPLFGVLSPLSASEALRDLEHLIADLP